MGNLVLNCRVQLSELLDGPVDRFSRAIEVDIGIYDDTAENEVLNIGTLEAHLFHISGMYNEHYGFADFYDCQSRHLADALEQIYDLELSTFHERIIQKGGFAIEEQIEWHLNLSRIDIELAHRGERYGVRALKLMRQYIERSGLIVTAKAHPEPRDAPRKPKRSEVKKLRDYYASEPALGFKRLGSPADGWLVANWSTV